MLKIEDYDPYENLLSLNHTKIHFQTLGPCVFTCAMGTMTVPSMMTYVLSPQCNQKTDGLGLWASFQMTLK